MHSNIFLSGWLVDKIGTIKLIFASILLTAIPTVFLGAGSGIVLAAIVVIQPMIAIVFFTPALAALAGLGPPETRNVAFSLTIPMAVLFGGGLFPLVLGFLGEAGRFFVGFIWLGIIMIVCLPMLFCCVLGKKSFNSDIGRSRYS